MFFFSPPLLPETAMFMMKERERERNVAIGFSAFVIIIILYVSLNVYQINVTSVVETN